MEITEGTITEGTNTTQETVTPKPKETPITAELITNYDIAIRALMGVAELAFANGNIFKSMGDIAMADKAKKVANEHLNELQFKTVAKGKIIEKTTNEAGALQFKPVVLETLETWEDKRFGCSVTELKIDKDEVYFVVIDGIINVLKINDKLFQFEDSTFFIVTANKVQPETK